MRGLKYSVKIDFAIGSTAAVVATAIPDVLLNYSGKFVFAILTAIFTSVVSSAVRSWFESRKKPKDPNK